jgi:hypothetical protein
MYRQGDVLLLPVDKLPESLEPIDGENGAIVLARGEATGHSHVIRGGQAMLFRDPKLAAIFMQVKGNAPVLLEHEEHGAIPIPVGNYRVLRQREYSPRWGSQQVGD